MAKRSGAKVGNRAQADQAGGDQAGTQPARAYQAQSDPSQAGYGQGHQAQSDPGWRSAAESGTDAERLRKVPKHQVVFDFLHNNIQTGVYKEGDKLPSEAELGAIFHASRITVAKAVLELQRMHLVSRRPGAGTHVQARQRTDAHTFGLLIPELGLTEIFEPICHGMMRSPLARPDALLWGNVSGAGASGSRREVAEEAEHLAQHFIRQGVSGVFFAPLELIPERDSANRRVMRLLERAKVPTVLLDRCYLPYPERSGHDLVGIDNQRTGYIVTEHLLQMGVTRLVFAAEEYSAQTVDRRLSGFFEALRRHRVRPDWETVWWGNSRDQSFVRRMVEAAKPAGIVCSNDGVAARVMQTLLGFGWRIPEEIRVVGVDDVKYAHLLPVPLTTMHQNCPAIGVMAMRTMHSRLEHPELPTRDVLLGTRLVVRRSCGAQLSAANISGGQAHPERP